MSSLGRPTDEQVERALSIIDARENWPVFVHCQRGADRTGVIIAAYRISHEQWTAVQAIAEAKRFGLAIIQFRKKNYISDYYNRRSKDQ
jgi:protein tyrosine/serine phosphatase